MEIKKQRLLLLDGIRGFAIVNMVLFHFLYDFFIIYQKDPKWYGKPLVGFWQQMICWTFIFISGMTWRLGKKKIKRGLLLNFWGLVITAITWLAMPTADGLVWYFKFSGMRLFAGHSYGKGFKENPCRIWHSRCSFWLFPFSKYQHRLFGTGGIRMDFPSTVVV